MVRLYKNYKTKQNKKQKIIEKKRKSENYQFDKKNVRLKAQRSKIICFNSMNKG